MLFNGPINCILYFSDTRLIIYRWVYYGKVAELNSWSSQIRFHRCRLLKVRCSTFCIQYLTYVRYHYLHRHKSIVFCWVQSHNNPYSAGIDFSRQNLTCVGSIRKYITAGICHRLVVALVTSNIDYCNGLLGGLAAKDVERLQRLQKRAARLVTRSKAAMHITPIRKDLHWLPIQKRINYKIIVTLYKCVHRLAPNYLSSILTTRTRDNRLRQKQVCHELSTHSCAKVVGKQAFGTRAPEQNATEH